ncbi:hypothetical protein KSP40_PGU015796 [Platanthera guangdongensis]|uniref:C2 domain-containing protein n=1 Tax=Platanthera guangdongensis TaxID=2320717 RepID=A0ABR2M1K5_9ASPA
MPAELAKGGDGELKRYGGVRSASGKTMRVSGLGGVEQNGRETYRAPNPSCSRLFLPSFTRLLAGEKIPRAIHSSFAVLSHVDSRTASRRHRFSISGEHYTRPSFFFFFFFLPVITEIHGVFAVHFRPEVVGCSKLKDTEWISRQDPYVVLEYASTKFRTRTCTDGGKHPTFQEKTIIPLIEGLREITVSVFNSNTITFDAFIGGGRVQLHKVLSQGYDDSSWSIQSKSGKYAGEVKLILHFSGAAHNTPGGSNRGWEWGDCGQAVAAVAWIEFLRRRGRASEGSRGSSWQSSADVAGNTRRAEDVRESSSRRNRKRSWAEDAGAFRADSAIVGDGAAETLARTKKMGLGYPVASFFYEQSNPWLHGLGLKLSWPHGPTSEPTADVPHLSTVVVPPPLSPPPWSPAWPPPSAISPPPLRLLLHRPLPCLFHRRLADSSAFPCPAVPDGSVPAAGRRVSGILMAAAHHRSTDLAEAITSVACLSDGAAATRPHR